MSGSTIVAAMNYGYDAANQLVSASDADSAYAFGYDNDGHVLTVDNNGTPGVLDVLLKSAYDTMGDRTSLAAMIAGTADLLNSYTYNADQRLTMLQQQGQSGGNTVSPKEGMAGYSTGSDNLLASDGTFNYQHDADGNQTVRTRFSNAYAADYKTTFAGSTFAGGPVYAIRSHVEVLTVDCQSGRQ